MNEQDIRNYFGHHIIYRFSGKLSDLLDLGLNVNYLVTGETIYFVSPDAVSAAGAEVFADNTQA